MTLSHSLIEERVHPMLRLSDRHLDQMLRRVQIDKHHTNHFNKHSSSNEAARLIDSSLTLEFFANVDLRLERRFRRCECHLELGRHALVRTPTDRDQSLDDAPFVADEREVNHSESGAGGNKITQDETDTNEFAVCCLLLASPFDLNRDTGCYSCAILIRLHNAVNAV